MNPTQMHTPTRSLHNDLTTLIRKLLCTAVSRSFQRLRSRIIVFGKCYKNSNRTTGDDVTSNTNCIDGGSGNTNCNVRDNCLATTASSGFNGIQGSQVTVHANFCNLACVGDAGNEAASNVECIASAAQLSEFACETTATAAHWNRLGATGMESISSLNNDHNVPRPAILLTVALQTEQYAPRDSPSLTESP